MMDNYKYDSGKPKLRFVPRYIITAIAKVREYGIQKYKTEDSWKKVEPERYRDALFRHLLLYLDDPYGFDEESKLPHLWHVACNVAFLCELEKDKYSFKLTPSPYEALLMMEGEPWTPTVDENSSET